MVKSEHKLKLKLTQEQSRDIRDYILNRELAALSHDVASISDVGSGAADMERVAEDKIPRSDSLKKCDEQGAELNAAKKFEGGDKPEQKHNKSLPKAKSERMPPLAHAVSYSDNLKNRDKHNDVEVAAEQNQSGAPAKFQLSSSSKRISQDKFQRSVGRETDDGDGISSDRSKVLIIHDETIDHDRVAEDQVPHSDSLKKCNKQGAELNAAKKFEGGDEPEQKHKLKLKLTQKQSRDIRDYILNRELAAISHGAADMERVAEDKIPRSDSLKKCDKPGAKKSENGGRPEQNQSLPPAKCQLSSKRISQGKCQTSVSKGTTDDIDGISSDRSKVFIIYDQRMDRHRPLSKIDCENAKRIPRILAKLKEKGLLERCGVSSKATSVDENHVSEVHSESYIQFIKRLPLRGKELEPYYEYLSDNPEERKEFVSSSGTQLAVFLAAGAVVEACCQVATGNYWSSFAIVRPPGHHAKHSQANGFCFLNNIAIGARYLQRVHNAKKILVIDFDVHHGDGTQEIFYQDDTVLFCSIHRESIFPIDSKKKCLDIGEGKGKGFNVNVSLIHELVNDDLLAVFDYLFLPLAKEYKPDYVLVSAGFDAAIDDLGESFVTPSCFGELIRKLKTISDGKLALALEGGYNLDSLAESCAECVKELLDNETTNVVKCRLEDVHKETLKAINQVKSALGECWPFLDGVAPDLT